MLAHGGPRSAATLESEFDEFERRIGQSMDGAILCGDLIFWPLSAISGEHRKSTHHPAEFWDTHRATLESGLLSDIVIGEIGRCMFAASETRYVDRFQDCDYMYGTQDSSPPSEPGDEDDEDIEDGEYEASYADRLFWSVGAQDWFDGIVRRLPLVKLEPTRKEELFATMKDLRVL